MIASRFVVDATRARDAIYPTVGQTVAVAPFCAFSDAVNSGFYSMELPGITSFYSIIKLTPPYSHPIRLPA